MRIGLVVVEEGLISYVNWPIPWSNWCCNDSNWNTYSDFGVISDNFPLGKIVTILVWDLLVYNESDVINEDGAILIVIVVQILIPVLPKHLLLLRQLPIPQLSLCQTNIISEQFWRVEVLWLFELSKFTIDFDNF